MNTTTKTLFASCMMALATSVFAADTGAGDRGPVNQVGPQSPSDTPPGNGPARADARRMARENYETALADCRSMSGAERAQCRRDARSTRDQAMRESRNAPSTSVMEAPRPAPGTTPADRADARMAHSQTQKDAGMKP
jgi:hypothetical protein